MLSSRTNKTEARVALKLETENPMASVKDRLALSVIINAEKRGLITPGKTTLIEATSGNTGIALAQCGAVRGYKVIVAMPETMSQERRALLAILGAEVILTPAALGMTGAKRQVDKLLATMPDSYSCAQFETEFNAMIHEQTTGPEIWAQTNGEVAALISGVGTGGTITGTGQFLKAKNPAVKIIAVEPDESAVLSGCPPGPHRIAGIGAGFVPQVLDTHIYDEVLRVKSDEAIDVARALPRKEGVFCGISSGAAVAAALRVAAREEMKGKLIVVIIPSFGERYLSTPMFATLREEVAKWPVVPASELQAPVA
jgi:cysteine synthase A